jgi:hypothetical protein
VRGKGGGVRKGGGVGWVIGWVGAGCVALVTVLLRVSFGGDWVWMCGVNIYIYIIRMCVV